jgi:hypothetical protein
MLQIEEATQSVTQSSETTNPGRESIVNAQGAAVALASGMMKKFLGSGTA